MKRTEITQKIKEGLSTLPYDMEVWLYGSEARGDARPDSDIDLLILFNKPKLDDTEVDSLYDITYPIELDSGVSISLFVQPKAKWESKMTPFRDNVQNDRIRL
ncbi:MAG: nucleotidyltransferase domain-containing protein [Bacteroidales bacterium]|nr:nucleotidyltransferase domain-containing protein [Bacteroidales bacterium]